MTDSDSNVPEVKKETLPEEPTTDLSKDDMVKVQKFIEEGMPGFGLLNEGRLHTMMDLYLSGKTYTQICRAMNMRKDLVLYVSHKFNWYMVKKEYLHELEFYMQQRVIEAKLMSKDFLINLQTAFQKEINDKLNAYLRTGDEQHARAIDLKVVDRLLKIIDLLNKQQNLSSDKSPGIVNVVNVANSGSQGTTIDGNPKQKTISKMLSDFANEARKKENNLRAVNSSDINEDKKVEDTE